MEIIPAIDLIDGKCVRLTKGDYGTARTYADDPLEQAKAFEGAGLRRLHLVDLDGAREKRPCNLSVLEKLASLTNLVIDYGGGMYSRSSLESAFSAGATYVTCGSMAVKNPEEAASCFASFPDRMILGADCVNGRIAVGAWTEESGIDAVDFIRQWSGRGARCCISTDVSKDGTLAGPGFGLYSRILESCDIALIASGGVSGVDDLYSLADLGMYGAIVGKAYYEGRIGLKELGEAAECLRKG